MPHSATQFQSVVQEKARSGKSLLIVAPTGLGKTFASTGDILDIEVLQKITYAVPLRALGEGVRRAASHYERNGKPVEAVVHHGSSQESTLFGEEFIITTYDQVVCGVPGLPLSLPLKAGHAVAGALLMSRLIFDEAHLAWGISREALSILLAVVKFRQSLGLQTILMTATLPDAVSQLICEALSTETNQIERVLVGQGGEVDKDKGLELRNQHRQVKAELLDLPLERAGETKQYNFDLLDERLMTGSGKKIYFANTVDRLQTTFDRLVQKGTDPARISVLHNRMPRLQRIKTEEEVHNRFGEKSSDNDWILLTNQVAEAGLDISAPLVITDPAPVDTLVQRAGRCARWFRERVTQGSFVVLNVHGLTKSTPDQEAKAYVLPYRPDLVVAAVKEFPKDVENMTWDVERGWVNRAWGLGEAKAKEAVQKSLDNTTFALNLFDRAAQERKPGEIANVFREILSVEVAIEEGQSVYIDDRAPRDLYALLSEGQLPDTSSISLGRGFNLMRKAAGRAAVIRYDREESQLQIRTPDTLQLGDILILPSSLAYLHPKKGLCFDERRGDDAILSSKWSTSETSTAIFSPGLQHRQSLSEHTRHVMDGSHKRLSTRGGLYRAALIRVLRCLEPHKSEEQIEQLVELVANLTRVAVAFHDLGKADVRWQSKVRQYDPKCMDEIDFGSSPRLVGRSISTGKRIGIPHTPPGYAATVAACHALLKIDGTHPLDPLVRAIALASCRHHSSLLQPALVDYKFDPHAESGSFISEMLSAADVEVEVSTIQSILEAATTKPQPEEVPLMFPNEDLFPIYALVGRAILVADREDAAGHSLEQWQ